MAKIKLSVHGEPTMQDVPVIEGKSFTWGPCTFVWWGFGKGERWRWCKSHIDIGPLSVFGFKKSYWFWRIIAVLIKPMRLIYDHSIRAKT